MKPEFPSSGYSGISKAETSQGAAGSLFYIPPRDTACISGIASLFFFFLVGGKVMELFLIFVAKKMNSKEV